MSQLDTSKYLVNEDTPKTSAVGFEEELGLMQPMSFVWQQSWPRKVRSIIYFKRVMGERKRKLE